MESPLEHQTQSTLQSHAIFRAAGRTRSAQIDRGGRLAPLRGAPQNLGRAGRAIRAEWRMSQRWLRLFALVMIGAGNIPTASAQAEFPYNRDLILDARPMRGSKRVPIVAVEQNGRAQIDLWCKRGDGQVTIAGDTIAITPFGMKDEPCTPERQQADEELLAALLQVTNWQMRGDVVTLSGGTALHFKAATN
jgi:heat shock protein HslJ